MKKNNLLTITFSFSLYSIQLSLLLHINFQMTAERVVSDFEAAEFGDMVSYIYTFLSKAVDLGII